jgi:hypothetical protein
MKITDFIKAHKAPVGGATAVIATAAFVLGTTLGGTPTVNLHQASDTTPDSTQSAPADPTAAPAAQSGTTDQTGSSTPSDGSTAPQTTQSTATAPDSGNSVTQAPAASQSSNPTVQMNEAQQAAAAQVVSSTQCYLYTPFSDPSLSNPDQVSYNATADYQVDTYSDGSKTITNEGDTWSIATNRGVVPGNECAGDVAPQS